MEIPNLTCQVCKKQLSGSVNLRNHMSTHTGERNFICQLCGKTYITSTALKHHLKTHTGEKKESGEKPYECEICHKFFFSAMNLHRHVSIGHTFFNCEFCNEKFLTKKEISVHLKKHGKLFKCELCCKTLDSKTELMDHQDLHRVETDFKCDKCEVYFNSEEVLRFHLRRDNKQKHICSKCGKKFLEERALRLHLQLHDKSIFTCYLCGESFRSVSSLKKHLARHSEGEDNFEDAAEKNQDMCQNGEDDDLRSSGSEGPHFPSKDDDDTSEGSSEDDCSGEPNLEHDVEKETGYDTDQGLLHVECSGNMNSGQTTACILNGTKKTGVNEGQNMPHENDEDNSIGYSENRNSEAGDKGKNTECVDAEKNMGQEEDEDRNIEQPSGPLMASVEDCIANEKDVNKKQTNDQLTRTEYQNCGSDQGELPSNECCKSKMPDRTENSTQGKDSESVGVRPDSEKHTSLVDDLKDGELESPEREGLEERTEKLATDRSTRNGFPSKLPGWTVMDFDGDTVNDNVNDCQVDISGIIDNLGDEDTSLECNAVCPRQEMQSKQKAVRKLMICVTKKQTSRKGSNKLFHKEPRKVKHQYQFRKKSQSCHICKKIFISYANLHFHMKTHIKTHRKPQSLKCKICSKRFYSKKVQEFHTLLHSKKRPLKCLECGKGFIFFCTLETHKKRHWNEKLQLYVTEYEKLVKQEVESDMDSENSNIFIDMLSARVVLNRVDMSCCFACSKCNKTFSESEQLEEHRAVHAVDKEIHSQISDIKTIQSQNSLEKKRKRGRPCKDYKTKDNEANAPSPSFRNKKRGRPRKYPKMSQVNGREHLLEEMEVLQDEDNDDISRIISQICAEATSTTSGQLQNDQSGQEIENNYSQNSVSNKKKRGRPRKYPKDSGTNKEEPLQELEVVDEDDDFRTLSSVADLIQNDQSGQEIENNYSQNSVPYKKKRGRPRKYPKDSGTNKEEPLQELEAVDEDDDFRTLSSVADLSQNDQSGQEIENNYSQNSVSYKKKRGRPRKYPKNSGTNKKEPPQEIEAVDEDDDFRTLSSVADLNQNDHSQYFIDDLQSNRFKSCFENKKQRGHRLKSQRNSKIEETQEREQRDDSRWNWLEIIPKQTLCDVCGEDFSSRAELNIHISNSHPKKEILKCLECSQIFFSKHHHNLHKKSHKRLKDLICPVCKEQYSSRGAYKKHFKGHRNEKLYCCDICYHYFRDFTSLRLHEKSHEPNITFSCSLCDKTLDSCELYKEHLLSHGKKGKRIADKIDSTSPSEDGVTTSGCTVNGKKKTKEQQNSRGNGSSLDPLEVSQTHCQHCGSFFICKEQLVQHVFCSHSEEYFSECSKCERIFFKKHHGLLHKDYHDKLVSFTCPVCETKTSSEEKLKKHFASCSEDTKTYYCNICCYHFLKKSYLEAHMITHDSDSGFACSDCNRVYACSRSLQKHLATHQQDYEDDEFEIYIDEADEVMVDTETTATSPKKGLQKQKCSEKPGNKTVKPELKLESQKFHDNEPKSDVLPCDLCPSKFNNRKKLITHMTDNHDSEIYHPCLKCNKVFLKIHHLKLHQSYHENIRTMTCLICSKQFSSEETLREHFDKHRRYVVYYCDICNHYFRDCTVMKTHMITHTGRKKYSCPECNKAYSDVRSIRHHLQKHRCNEDIEAYLKTVEKRGPRPRRNPDQPAKKRIHKVFLSEESEVLKTNTKQKKKKMRSRKQKVKKNSKLKEEPSIKEKTSNNGTRSRRQSIKRSTQDEVVHYKEETSEDEEETSEVEEQYLIDEEMPLQDDEVPLTDEVTPQGDTNDHGSESSGNDKVMSKHNESSSGPSSQVQGTPSKEPSNEDLQQTDSQNTEDHVPETTNECIPCNLHFESQSQLNEHLEKHAPVEWYTCTSCNEIFENKHLLNIHTRSHSGIHPYKCSRCPETFLDYKPLYDHVHQHQKKDSERGAKANLSDGKDPEIKSDDKVPASQTLSDDRGPESEASTDDRGPASETLSDDRGPESEALIDDRGPESEALIDDRGPVSEALSNDRGPESEALTDDRGLASGTLSDDRGLASGTLSDDRGPASGTLSDDRGPVSGTLSDDMSPESEALTDDMGPANASNPCYSCSHCKKVFDSEGKYKKHVEEHKDGNKFWCQFCGEFFHDDQKFKKHTEFHFKLKPFECNICRKYFTSIATVKRHVNTDCGKMRYDGKNKTKKFPLKKKQNAHVMHSSGKFQFKCLICGKEFATTNLFDQHMQVREGEIKCHVCCEHFDSKTKLMEHMNNHFECEICHKKFYRKGSYIKHKASHTRVLPPKNTKCGICGRVLASLFILRSHMKVHQNERNYKCKFCEKAFVDKRQLRSHLWIHTKENSIICETCGVAVRSKSDLKIHMSAHTEERPYLCHMCSAGFKDKKALKGHIARHEYWDRRQSEKEKA